MQTNLKTKFGLIFAVPIYLILITISALVATIHLPIQVAIFVFKEFV